LTISVEGVAIQEPKTKKILHQYPLHKISYCADDKAEKRFFSFISKDGDGKHTCFVFVSDKLAEEITLTIGQAFELAYKKYLDTNGKELETQKQLLTLQKRIELLENENSQLKSRLRDISKIKGEQDIQDYLTTNKLSDICEVNVVLQDAGKNSLSDSKSGKTDADKNESDAKEKSQISSEQNDSNQLISFGVNSTLDEKLDGLSLDDLNDEDFNPRIHDETESGSSMTGEAQSTTGEALSMTGESQIQSFGSNPFSTKPSGLNPKASLRMDPFQFGSAYTLPKPPFPSKKTTVLCESDPFKSDNSLVHNSVNEKHLKQRDPFGMDAFDAPISAFSINTPANSMSTMKNAVELSSLSIDDFDPLKDGRLN